MFCLIISLIVKGQTSKTLNVTAGTLSSALTTTELQTVTDLTLTGTIDARDFKTMRDSMNLLTVLDLSSTSIVNYIGELGTSGSSGSIFYESNAIPICAFYMVNKSRGKTSLTTVNLPESTTAIENAAFFECSNLKSFSIPSTVNKIGASAFFSCISLTTIELPTSVTKIEDFAFGNCQGLIKLPLTSSVVSIGKSAFYQCYQVADLAIPSSVTSIGNNAFENCVRLKSVSIPSSVVSIGGWAFTGCFSLNTIDLPTSVTSIPESIFYDCNNLTSVTIPSTVKSIGEYAFQSCYKLTSINIPTSVTSIGHGAFCESGLISVSIPSSVTFLGDVVFSDCANLMTVNLSTSITAIGYGTFYRCKKLTNLIIPPSITSIGPDAFHDCIKLTSVIIPSSVTSIGASIFAACGGLTSVEISSSATVLRDRAFGGCYRLASIVIPSSIRTIESEVFYYCSGLKSIYSYSTYPIDLTNSHNVFQNVNKTTCTLYVPSGSKSAYESANQWQDFITILEFNPVPVANAGSDQMINEGNLITLDGSGSKGSISNNALTYLWTAPAEITLSSATDAKPTFTAPQVQADQNYTFSLVVSDGTASSTADQVIITVKQVNKVPTANAGVNQTVNEVVLVSLDGTASSDPDNDALSYQWTAPAGITLSSATVAKPTFTAPEVQTDQNYTFTLVVNDGTASSTADQVIITVKQVNKVPTANAGVDQTVNEGVLVSLDGTGSSDPDNDALSYQWNVPAGITLSSATAANSTFTAPQVQSDQNYTFSLVVNDGTVSSADDQVVITVKQVNKAPIANAGADQSINEGTLMTLDGSLSSDPDGTPITYLWTAPVGITLSSRTAQKPTFTTTEVSVNTDYTFSLVVNDGTVSSTADQVVVTVKQVNKAPVANAGADQSVNEVSLVTLDGSLSTDADGNPITYLWTAPAGITLSSNTAQKPSFTAAEVSQDTPYTFSLVVNDGQLNSTTSQVVITVKQVPTILRLTSKANNLPISAAEVNYHLFIKKENGFSEKNISPVINGAATQFSIEPGEWIILASPVQNSTLFVPTYAGNVLNWDDAEHMIIPDKGNISKEITCFVPEIATIGLGQISGYVYQGSGTKSISMTETFFDSGNPIPGALIRLFKKGSTIPVLSIFTDSKGFYQFDRLEIAEYEIAVELPGFTQSGKFEIALSTEQPLNSAYFKVNMTSLVITDNNILLSPPIKFYPNPIRGVVNITGLPSIGPNKIAIYTIEGKLVKEKTTNSTTETIDISDQTPGIYIMRINNQTFKICKE